MVVDIDYIKTNSNQFDYGNVSLCAISENGLAINLVIPSNIDFLDFIEELGIYFYRIDDPKFGQKFINEETKLYIYDWLVQILNTGNYDEEEETDNLFATLEFFMDFEKLNTFKYALRKYKEKYRKEKDKVDYSKALAEITAINILEIIEKVRINALDENVEFNEI